MVHPKLPEAIIDAAGVFAREGSARGDMLDEHWLNNDAMSATDYLPPGWMDRLQVAYLGPAIPLHSLGREEVGPWDLGE